MAEPLFKISVNLPAIEKTQDFLERYQRKLIAALEDGLNAIALEIQKSAVIKLTEQGSVDQGQLRASITIHQVSRTKLIVGTNVTYAAAVEYGAKPHWIRIDKTPGFRTWMRHHGIDLKEDMVYFHVAPKPKPYVEPAFEEGKKYANRNIPDLVDKALKQAGGS